MLQIVLYTNLIILTFTPLCDKIFYSTVKRQPKQVNIYATDYTLNIKGSSTFFLPLTRVFCLMSDDTDPDSNQIKIIVTKLKKSIIMLGVDTET